MTRLKLIAAITAVTVVLAGCDKDYDDDQPAPAPDQPAVVSAAGNIDAAIAQFKDILGDASNNVQITWDGVPDNLTNNDDFPLGFFNNTDPAGPNGRKKGLVYTANGTTIRIDSSAFVEIDASYAANFKSFSGDKLVIAANSNITEIQFRVPATNTPASVKGFGLVFSDVDQENYTTVQFFDGNKSLGTYKAPVRKDANGFSFLGVHFPNDKVTRIKITAGNGILAYNEKDVTDGGNKDLVAFDDFFYSTPLATN